MKPAKGFKKSKLFEWQERNNAQEGVCAKCGRTTKMTVDHIIPVMITDRLDEGYEIATNDEENFQLLCRPCNTMKSGNIDITNPKTARLLVKYMQPYL